MERFQVEAVTTVWGHVVADEAGLRAYQWKEVSFLVAASQLQGSFTGGKWDWPGKPRGG